MDDLVGQALGPYQVLEQLGAGAMGTVYKAYQPTMDRYVAIKVLPRHLARDPNFRARFQREARTIARLEHRYILPVYDFGEDHGIHYLVMRYTDGGTLEDLISGGALSIEQAVQFVSQIGEALAYAHQHGVIHRDIKPPNVLIGRDGSVLLADFGVAKIVEETLHLTGEGLAVGTPSYMAPEQIQGQPVDARTDIYALGILLYQAVTGEFPFVAETALSMALMHLHTPPRPPRQLNPTIPETLEQVILRALEKDPINRFQTADAMVAALHAVLAGASARPTRTLPPVASSTSASTIVTGISPQQAKSPVLKAAPKAKRNLAIVLIPVVLVLVTAISLVVLNSGRDAPSTPIATTGIITPVIAAPTLVPTTVPTLISASTPASTTAPIARSEEFVVSFDVYAEKPWQSTGVHIKAGDTLQISYQSGAWSENATDTPQTGPEGIKVTDDYDCMPISRNETGGNALIARIGDNSPFKTRGYLSRLIEDEGILYLRMNDCDERLNDNTGIINVNIQVIRSAASASESTVATTAPKPPTVTLLRTLTGHGDWLLGVAFSPDGQILASASFGAIVELWQVQDGLLLRTLKGHTDWVMSVAFSPDGQTLASASKDRTIRLWRVSDGTPLRTLEGHLDNVASVAFSPDGQTLASASQDQTIKIWRVSDGTLLNTLKGHAGFVRSIAFAPDGQTLISSSDDNTAKLWRVGDGAQLRTLQGHVGGVYAVAFSPDGQLVASGSVDQTVKLWRVSDGALLHTLEGHGSTVNSVMFSPDGQMLASASYDRTIKLWQVSDGTLLHTLGGHTGSVFGVAFAPNGQVLATASEDQMVNLWEIQP